MTVEKQEGKMKNPRLLLYPFLMPLVITLVLQVFFEHSCTASGYPVHVVDSDGRHIIIEAPFSRIISLYPAHTENLVQLGAGEKLVGVSRNSRPFKGVPQNCRILGYRDDLERFLALKPDLVLIRPMISRSHPGLVRGLEKSGITVISLQPTSPAGLYDYWGKLGDIAGTQEAAAHMKTVFMQKVESLRKRVALIPAPMLQKVYFEAIHRRMKTFAPNSFQVFCLETAGGINIATDAVRVRNTNIAAYGKERILAKAGMIDVFLAQRGRMNPVTRGEIISEPGFQVIKAVRNGQVYLVDEALVSRPTLRLTEGMERIFNILYPARSGRD